MAITDPIADMLTTLRNANRARHEHTEVRRSKLALAILAVLKRERFLYDFKTVEDETQGRVRVYLKPPPDLEGARIRRIQNIRRISKPGLRIYATRDRIPRVLSGLGVCVVSTSRGIMTGEEARRQRVGGEVLLTIW
jgi:small subunit ribosomal protein S8